MPAPPSPPPPVGPAPTPADIARAVARTLQHYDRAAQAYWEGTRDHDVSQNIAALLSHIESDPPFAILDVGCGPGRDLAAFARLGHRATGVEGSAAMAALARDHSGAPVLEQDLLHLALPAAHFDGLFANAVLFHVPRPELPRVLRDLHAALKPGGVLLCSNPRGQDQENWTGDRYGAFYEWTTWRAYMEAAGFAELTHYYRPPGLPREQQPWLASAWRKPLAETPGNG